MSESKLAAQAKPVLTAVVGTNADLIAEVARLYIPRKAKVADLTFGRGVFWKKVDLGRVGIREFFASDIAPVQGTELQWNGKPFLIPVNKGDFRSLPVYVKEAFDVVVLDPPYMHGGASVLGSIKKCYKNGGRSTKYASHEAIIELYRSGIDEAWRVLKPGGLLWVKCQDEIESGRQRWSHVEIMEWAVARITETATSVGRGAYEVIDLFILVQSTTPARRLPYQLHARKNHSYLWVFRKK